MGLNIARGIVQQHQGSIFATSEGIGHGTTFHVCLPVVAVVATPLSLPSLPPNTSNSSRGCSREFSFSEDAVSANTPPTLLDGGGALQTPPQPSATSENSMMTTAKKTSLRVLVVDDAISNR